MREYWYVPDESNFDKNAASTELVGSVPSEAPVWSFMVGVPAYLPATYMLPDESHATP